MGRIFKKILDPFVTKRDLRRNFVNSLIYEPRYERCFYFLVSRNFKEEYLHLVVNLSYKVTEKGRNYNDYKDLAAEVHFREGDCSRKFELDKEEVSEALYWGTKGIFYNPGGFGIRKIFYEICKRFILENVVGYYLYDFEKKEWIKTAEDYHGD